MTGPIPDELARQIAATVSYGSGAVDKLDMILSRCARTSALLAATADAAHIHGFPLFPDQLAGALEGLNADLETARVLFEHLQAQRP